MELGELAENIERLQKLISETPEIITMLQLLKETKTEHLVLPQKGDKLIGTSEALDILKVSDSTFRSYWQRGLLRVMYTPDSNKRKFWLSEVMAIPQEAKA